MSDIFYVKKTSPNSGSSDGEADTNKDEVPVNGNDTPENISENPEKPLDFSPEYNTIKSQITSEFNDDYGVPGMKWGVTKEKEEKTTEKTGVKKTKVTQFETKNGVMTVTDDTNARLGAKGSVKIMKGEITNVETFAGKGSKKPMDLAEKFATTYGGKPEDWMHSTGNGKIKFADGTEKNAEIHWFECEGVGQTKWKIKKFKKG